MKRAVEAAALDDDQQSWLTARPAVSSAKCRVPAAFRTTRALGVAGGVRGDP
jgi:hypothetical protein